jgi:hypothetical protein
MAEKLTCIYCREYREYCKCEREQMPPTLEDVYQLHLSVKKLHEKVDTLLESVKEWSQVVPKVEL